MSHSKTPRLQCTYSLCSVVSNKAPRGVTSIGQLVQLAKTKGYSLRCVLATPSLCPTKTDEDYMGGHCRQQQSPTDSPSSGLHPKQSHGAPCVLHRELYVRRGILCAQKYQKQPLHAHSVIIVAITNLSRLIMASGGSNVTLFLT